MTFRFPTTQTITLPLN